MPTTQLQLRRGNTAQTSVFTGAIGEVTVDTDRKTITVHDGSTVGGTYVATNIQLTSAYGKANAANVLAQSAFDKANTIMPSANANTSAYASKYFVEFNPTTNTFSYTSYPDASNPYITGYGPEIHVSPVALNDSGRGTIGDPVKTIARAQALAALAFETTAVGQRKTIILHPGDYTENVTIDVQYTVLTTHELIGKNTTLSGTLTLNKGCTIDGLKMTNLVISGTSANGSVDIIGSTVVTSASKTGSAYVNFRGCDLSSAALSVTGTGTVIMVGGNYGSLTVSNPYAGVLAKAVISMGPTTLTAGTLNISDTLVYAANNTANAITQSSGSVLTLNNSQVLIPDFTNVSRMSLTGYYSILHSVYDKTNSRLQGNTSLSSISYSQFINLDRLILSTNGQITYPDGSIQTSSNGIQAAFDQANNNTTVLTSAYNFANSVNTYAYSSNVYLSGLVTTANTDMKAYVDQANTGLKSYVDQANTGMASYVLASNTAMKAYVDQANTGLKSYVDQANTGMASYVVASNTAMKAYVDQANTGLKSYVDQANTGMASYVVSSNTAMKAYVDQANTGLKSYSDATYFTKTGGTISGDVTISSNNNLTVTGNLIVQGTTFSSNSTTFEINDPLLLLGTGNYFSDSRDIGFVSHYNDGSNAHTGLFRDSGTKEYYFFKGYTPDLDSNNEIDIAHASFEKANVQADKVTSRFLVANSATLGGIDVITYSTAAFDKANTGNTIAQSAYNFANTVNTYAFSAYSVANSAAANTVITQGVDSTQNTWISSNAAFTQSAFTLANTANVTAEAAFSKANSANLLAQGAFTSANTRANSFSGTTGSATPAGGGITFTSTNGITISGTSSTLTINSPQDLQSTATPTFKGVSYANTATGNRGIVRASTATVAQTAIDTWSTSTYRTAKYIVSMSSGANYHAIELLLIHDGTTPSLTQYAEVIIGSSLATFDASIASTTLTLLANPATTSSITYNLLRDNIGA
jgi:hypothetical protein